jgi:hypothetical protein
MSEQPDIFPAESLIAPKSIAEKQGALSISRVACCGSDQLRPTGADSTLRKLTVETPLVGWQRGNRIRLRTLDFVRALDRV